MSLPSSLAFARFRFHGDADTTSLVFHIHHLTSQRQHYVVSEVQTLEDVTQPLEDALRNQPPKAAQLSKTVLAMRGKAIAEDEGIKTSIGCVVFTMSGAAGLQDVVEYTAGRDD